MLPFLMSEMMRGLLGFLLAGKIEEKIKCFIRIHFAPLLIISSLSVFFLEIVREKVLMNVGTGQYYSEVMRYVPSCFCRLVLWITEH